MFSYKTLQTYHAQIGGDSGDLGEVLTVGCAKPPLGCAVEPAFHSMFLGLLCEIVSEHTVPCLRSNCIHPSCGASGARAQAI